MVQQIDKKVENEIGLRLKSEEEARQWFTQQLQVLKQSQTIDGSQALDREKQMMMQLNSGLAQISEVVKQVKAQSAQQLKELALN